MTTMTVETRIKQYVQDRFLHNGRTQLAVQDSLLDSGLVDSAGIFDLVAYLENEFSIQVMDEEITPEHFESVGSMASFVDEKLRG